MSVTFFKRLVDAVRDEEKMKESIVIKRNTSFNQNVEQLKLQLDSLQDEKEKKQILKQIKLIEIGNAGESSVLFELENAFLPFCILHDLRLEYKDYKTQIDFLLITRKFLLVLEVKKYYGNINVNEKGEFQRLVRKGNRITFREGVYSPIRQVERQAKILKELLSARKIIRKTPIYHAIVFANDKTILELNKAPKQIREHLLRVDHLAPYLKELLKKSSPVYFLDNRLKKLAEEIAELHQPGDILEIDDEQIDLDIAAEPVNDEQLLVLLKEFRERKARELGMKSFYIFTNQTLEELANKKPTSITDLRTIRGIGDKKIATFGQELIQVILKLHK